MQLPLLLFLAVLRSTALGFINITNIQDSKPAEGKPCKSPGSQNFAIDDYPTKFLHCNPTTKRYIVASCPTLQGKALLFDERNQECTSKFSSVRRTPGIPRSSHFGEPCSQNTDCMGNMFCPAGTCLCLPGYIDIGQHCYQIINPGQPNCINTRQCAAVWPGAFCQNGVCQCPNDKKPLDTKDGVVCHRLGFCPLPDDVVGKPSALPEGKCEGTNPLQYCAGLTDLYDCVPDATESEKICCPNRALTCIQSKTDSLTSVIGSQSRYWYNSVTGNCEQFLFDPTSTVATANNFLTIEQCQSYCSVTCKRGSPQYVGHAPRQCQSTAQCDSTAGKYQCTAVGSKRLCCPSIQNFICSPTGGRLSGTASPDSGVGALSETRWYYDSALKTCQSFLYKGYGGNFNNFLSQQDCMTFCIQNVCEQGDPLRDLNGNVQQCSGGRGCPSSYECRRNVCCPNKQTVCSQPKLVGTCTSAVTKFWYNTVTRDCESFTYTGCNGNDNNFDSYIQCVSFCRDSLRKPTCPQGEADKDSSGKYYTCSITGGTNQCRPNFDCVFDGSIYGCCPKKPYTCSLNRAAGTACSAPTVRWFFDPTAKVCKTFTYLGCDGNSNNFDTKERCERYCGVGGCPYGGKPYQDDTMSIRVCNDVSVTCPSSYECVTVPVSNSAVRYCCPTRASICTQPPNRGTQCGSPMERYYFNPVLKQCVKFTYYGCSGNENNFPSLAACMNFCSSSACEAGEGIIMDPVTQSPMKCNLGNPSSCPTGYTCRSDSLTGANICCGASDMGVCPASELAYVDPLTQQVRECQPGATVSCPSNYLCRPNPGRNRYFCCRVAQTGMCPPGKAAYYDMLTLQPQTCIIGPFNTCPADYSCQSTTNQREGFCCTVQALCPNNEEFLVDPVTKSPKACSLFALGYQQCPAGYTCRVNRPGLNSGYCCRALGVGQGVCPSGQPLYEGANPRGCTPGLANNCPNGYTCLQSVSNPGLYYCCSIGGIEATDGCPPGSSAYKIQGAAQGCQPGVPSCPGGYSCQYSSAHGRYQCCSISTGVQTSVCPSGQPYLDGTVPRGCTPGLANNCPQGFTCVASISSPGLYYCCSIGGGMSFGCPPGTSAYIIQGTPQDCTPGIQSCPTGYTCQYSSERGRYQCCGAGAVGPPSVCPANQAAYIDPATGQAMICTPGGYCPAGYVCTATQSGVSHCCASSPGVGLCVKGEPARENGNLAQCSVNVACPPGYTCTNSVCCPTRERICSMPLNVGYLCITSMTSTIRYYYNSQSKQCMPFSYYGCGGNDNNFMNIFECNNFCLSGGGQLAYKCPYPDHQPYYPPGMQVPQSCTPGVLNQCPRGYLCHNTGSGFICCGRPQTGQGWHARCPFPNQRPYMQPGTNSPMRCQPASPQSCPMNYACLNGGDGFICCESKQSALQVCPAGSRPYLTPQTNAPMRCSGNVCPAGFRCTYSAVGQGYFCCSAGTVIGGENPCPSNLQTYVTFDSGQLFLCNHGTATKICPLGFTCNYSSFAETYICCGNPVRASVNGCPSGRPYLYPNTNKPLNCRPGMTACPRGFRCVYSTVNQAYQCCSVAKATANDVFDFKDDADVK